MATRFYGKGRTLSTGITPSSWSAGWTRTTGATTHNIYGMSVTYLNTNNSLGSAITTTATANEYGAHHRWIIGPLLAQTISGTMAAQFLCYQFDATQNATLAMAVKIITSAGADRAILLPVTTTSNLTYELATTGTNRSFRDASDNTSVSLTSGDAQLGDYLVVEVGYYQQAAVSGSFQVVEPTATSILPVDDSTTTASVSWFEFSDDIWFQCEWVGTKSNPNDDVAASLATTPVAITPFTGISSGDLVVMIGQCRAASATLSVSATGGQTWTSETAISTTNQTARLFWCKFNGTWSADPSVSFSSSTCTTVVMHVFRAYGSGTTWSVNKALVELDVAAATTITITGQTTTGTNPTVTLAGWFTADDNTWGSLSGSGWENTNNIISGTSNALVYHRNTASTDQSCTFAYKQQTSAGATGNVSMNELLNGTDAATTFIITFAAAVPVVTTSFIYNPLWHTQHLMVR